MLPVNLSRAFLQRKIIFPTNDIVTYFEWNEKLRIVLMNAAKYCV